MVREREAKKEGVVLIEYLIISYSFLLFLAHPLPWSDVNHVISSAMTDLLNTGGYGDQIQCYEFIYQISFTHRDNLVWLLTWLSLGLG